MYVNTSTIKLLPILFSLFPVIITYIQAIICIHVLLPTSLSFYLYLHIVTYIPILLPISPYCFLPTYLITYISICLLTSLSYYLYLHIVIYIPILLTTSPYLHPCLITYISIPTSLSYYL